jgi:predicted metal-dependent phosphoesterase TrpH
MLKVDLHIHTVASGHAYNTILEYANGAKELKWKLLASVIWAKIIRQLPTKYILEHWSPT